MLSEGEKIHLGNEEYEVKRLHEGEGGIPCEMCQLKNCTLNKYWDEIKAKHFALTCTTLLPPRGYLKLIIKT